MPALQSHPGGSRVYRLAKAILGKPLHLVYRVQVEGMDNLPKDGPVILAANHRSFMDSVFLGLTSPRPVSFVAKAEYWDRPVSRWIVRGLGAIPLRRGSPAAARQALEAASDVLAQGRTLGIYPEGTRSRDGKLHRGNPGPARLSRDTGAAIVPVGLIGTDEVQSPGKRLPRPFRTVTVRFGAARRFPVGDGADSKRVLRDQTNQLMHDIAKLCGQEYVDRFAPVPVG